MQFTDEQAVEVKNWVVKKLEDMCVLLPLCPSQELEVLELIVFRNGSGRCCGGCYCRFLFSFLSSAHLPLLVNDSWRPLLASRAVDLTVLMPILMF